jgi:integrase
MATIQSRGPYQWRVQIRKKGFPSQTKTFDTKADAEIWARSIENEMDRGIFVSRKESESTTLSEALDRYETEISALKKSHTAEKSYIRTLKKSPMAHQYMASIQGSDVAKYRDNRLKEVSSTAVLHELALLSHLFTIAIKEWGMSGLVNPVTQIRKPAPDKSRDRRTSPEELKKLLNNSSQGMRGIILFAVETAMRRAEIAGMTWDMVDFEKRTVTLLKTKNGEKRIVPLSLEAVRILSGIVRRTDGKVWDQDSSSITHAFAYSCKIAGIGNLNFHDLRHEATSRLFEKGFNLMEVAAITGHKTLQMLQRYTHLKAEDLAKKMDG